VNATFGELRAAGVPTIGACALIGRSRATHYRHAQGPLHGPRPARSVPDNGHAPSAAERQAVLTLINTPAYADLMIGQEEKAMQRGKGDLNRLYRAADTWTVGTTNGANGSRNGP